MGENMLQLLYRSFDAQLSAEEQEQLDSALKKSAELRTEQERIAQMRRNIAEQNTASFKPFFADRVMQRIREKTTQTESDVLYDSMFRFFKPVMIAVIILIITITFYNIGSTKQFSLAGALAVPQVTIEDAYDPSLTFNYGVNENEY
jgi:hypothetical protein